jgi:hypothetical protein
LVGFHFEGRSIVPLCAQNILLASPLYARPTSSCGLKDVVLDALVFPATRAVDKDANTTLTITLGVGTGSEQGQALIAKAKELALRHGLKLVYFPKQIPD